MIIFEIDKGWIKALWGRMVLKDLQVSGVAAVPITSATPEDISKAVKGIIDEKSFKKFRPIILCMPRSQVTLRSLKFPSKDDKELSSIISLNVTQQVPYSREEIIYSHMILEKSPPGFTKVLMGILHKDFLRSQFAVFEKLNLYPENVQLSTVGLMRFLQRAKVLKDSDTQFKACLDIDEDSSDFAIFKGDKIFFSKSIAMGSLKLQDPDKLKRFIGELKQAAVVFQAEEGKEKFSNFFLTGAVSDKMRLEYSISNELQVPVETIYPADAVGSVKAVKGAAEIARKVSISHLLGVALEPLSEKLNFILPEAKLKKDVRDMAKNMIVSGSAITYLIILMCVGFIGATYGKEGYLAKISDDLEMLEGRNQASVEATEKIKIMRNFTRQKDSFLYYYYRLVSVIPDNITLNRVIFGKVKEFSLLGKANDMGDIFKFVTILSDTKVFGKVELRYSRKKKQGNTEFNEFEIVCHLG